MIQSVLAFVAAPVIYFLRTWIMCLCFQLSISTLLQLVFGIYPLAKPAEKKTDRLEFAKTDIHARWTRPEKRFEWFSVWDCAYRYSLTCMVIVWC